MPQKNFRGIPASAGIAIGSVFCYIPTKLTVPDCPACTINEEMARFETARKDARVELQHLFAAMTPLQKGRFAQKSMGKWGKFANTGIKLLQNVRKNAENTA